MLRSFGVMACVLMLGCGDGPDEWTCEVELAGVLVCVDTNADREQCESNLGGVATAVEREPGGPYVYCEDLGYVVPCTGSIVDEGDGYSASYNYKAETEEDCAAADESSVEG